MLLATQSPNQRRLDLAVRRQVAMPTVPSAGWVKRQEAIMGTAISVELWCDERRHGEAAAQAVMDEMQRIDRAFSPYKPASELCRVNREAAHHAVPVSGEMAYLLHRALHFSKLTSGAFDITYAAAGQLYDYRQGLRPTDLALKQACARIGWQGLELDMQRRTVRFKQPGMRIDLGGFAKGHAVDNATRLLAQRGITNAMVCAGGDSRAIGDKRGRPWNVAVRHPRRAGEAVAVLPLQDVSISTSGDYERYFEDGPERVHHLLDPRTGKSACGVRSATVLADDGLTCEALSKAVFVLGAEPGLQLINTLPGVDAVVVDAQGALSYSHALQQAA
jgi:FAD:protein FMN transferase